MNRKSWPTFVITKHDFVNDDPSLFLIRIRYGDITKPFDDFKNENDVFIQGQASLDSLIVYLEE